MCVRTYERTYVRLYICDEDYHQFITNLCILTEYDPYLEIDLRS